MNQQRINLRNAFVQSCNLGEINETPLSVDASFRCYFRLTSKSKRYILMDAPPDKENLAAYIKISNHLLALGLDSPKIYKHDLINGFALIEDFGDDTFTKLLNNRADEIALYRQAIETLAKLHQNDKTLAIELPTYSTDILIDEALLFYDWYLPLHELTIKNKRAREDFITSWRKVLSTINSQDKTLVLRDFHVDNLIKLDNNQCGLLDFQDALIGPCAYDLVSLLEDARRDMKQATQNSLLTQYFKLNPKLNTQSFNSSYQILGCQRHFKVLGIFCRLSMRDNKSQYLKHLPHVKHLLLSHININELSPIKHWLNEHVSEFIQQP